MSDADTIPVIVGIGEIADRPADPARGLEPLALMAEALRRAEADAGADLLARIDSLDIVNQVSWPYAAPAQQLSDRIGARPARAVYGPVGGESPIRYLHEAALRIRRGDSRVAAICGAEATSTLAKAAKAGVALDWTPKPETFERPLRGRDIVHPACARLGVDQPITIYPFYENAAAHHWGQSPAEAAAESGLLWSRYAAATAGNPYAWLNRPFSAEEIVTPGPANRPIAYPYTKMMVANPMVNQGAALLVTSLAAARAAGIAESRLVHILGGAAANEPRDYLQRDHYHGSQAQDAVLEAARDLAGAAGFRALELYSCFPCVPKMARRTLGLGEDVQPSVTGGLTFFGAPLNDYMTHAACAMVRTLRAGGGRGLLYGQGEFVTKHHALVLGDAPGGLDPDYSVQALADGRRGPVPAFVEDAAGEAALETFTVIYGRDGEVSQGVAILRLDDGARTLARVPAGDADGIALLTAADRFPIGRRGRLRRAADGIADWQAA
ncbi:acetyl-CoA acetyltransferase [Zavarzinia compransoris]|uniref:Acetyl-CoA acetyltransferase n=1 Tax=Zavarzinia compransoris TaxID=1264899 RepID=A0A317EBJ0_9PROT|nr:acetyl-CoA acetyltransferase [Zavarzinia compransoris]PWR23624.1 acetyl-CoA acetyltransferase [Zavarzinia compransoris]TDP47843.1 acetyl-CoA C-acetyltransferase/hypothetical protein [Zavarzinia compransoris]